MGHRKKEAACEEERPQTDGLSLKELLWLFVVALIIGISLYSPALTAPFVFDDNGLPFRRGMQDEPLTAWLTGVRPMLMFSYWVNYHISAEDPFTYHILNVIIHAANAVLVYVVLFRLLSFVGWASKRRLAAGIGAAVFLIHPLATESVSYIAGRSESLATFFMLLAYAIFLTRYDETISWKRSAIVLLLSGIAIATKENAVALIGLFVLTDLFWSNPFSLARLRANYRLYLLMAPGVALGIFGISRVLATAVSAGFSFSEFTWYQYAFTEARAIFKYMRLAVLPFGQSLDHDFPISHKITDHGAIICIAALLLLTSAAIIFRRRYPLACFGLLMLLILLAPTSSIVPIADPLVERRFYFPLVGLILVGYELAGRLRRTDIGASAIAAMLLVFSILCYERNQLWAAPEQLWASAAQQSGSKGRPYWHLAEALVAENRCSAATPYLEYGERLMPHDYSIEIGWAKVEECEGRFDEALERLQQAARMKEGPFVYQWIGLLYGEMGRTEEAGAALRKAVQLGPSNGPAHSALGLWYESVGDLVEAEREYRIALSIDGHSREAQTGLNRVQTTAATSSTNYTP